MKKVAILGFGPSSLFAIVACNEMDIIPVVITDRPATCPVGAFYYHKIPPSFEPMVRKDEIKFTYIGNEAAYLQKQWGDPFVYSSWGRYNLEYGYNPQDFYTAVSRECTFILETDNIIVPESLPELSRIYSKIFCSVVMHTRHFASIPVSMEITQGSENKIEYNGNAEDLAVRTSDLFGIRYVEYPPNRDIQGGILTYIKDISPLSKPGINIDIPANITMIGRNAMFRRDELAHNAYERVLDELRRSI
jgi:hypothetical protein